MKATKEEKIILANDEIKDKLLLTNAKNLLKILVAVEKNINQAGVMK